MFACTCICGNLTTTPLIYALRVLGGTHIFRSYLSTQNSVTIDDVCLKVQPPKPCFCLDQSISPPDHLFILASQASQSVLFKGQIPKPCSSFFSLMDERTRDGVCGTSNKPFCGISISRIYNGCQKVFKCTCVCGKLTFSPFIYAMRVLVELTFSLI